ncbi:MAG: peptide deformylase [Pseudomonadota bacterium]
MTLRPILIHPDARLRKVTKPIEDVSDALRKLADDMLDTMYDAPGIGLAAPQVGSMARLFVMDCASREEGADPDPIVMFNPEIVAASDELSTYEEGCLSFPDQYAEVKRPAMVQMRWIGLDGAEKAAEFDGIQATCAQHELDHLNGKLFIDHLGAVKRAMIVNKVKKLKAKKAG